MDDTPQIISELTPLIEKCLDALLPQESNLQKEIFEACRYSLLAGGKRLRPSLCMIFYHLCGGQAQSALDFASAIEMIHSYSLVHDDLPCMDNSDYRRGRPACHKVYGYSTAVLAGDGLLNRAFEVMTSPLEGIDPLCQLSAAHVMATASGIYGMVGGQVIDLAIEGAVCSPEQLHSMVELKTSALIAGACKSGCCLAGADPETAEAAWQYGQAIGLAFQIRDDVLDLVGDQTLLGKPLGEDAQKGKNTFASMYGVKKCHQMIEELTQKALELSEVFPQGNVLKDIALWLLSRNY